MVVLDDMAGGFRDSVLRIPSCFNLFSGMRSNLPRQSACESVKVLFAPFVKSRSIHVHRAGQCI